MPEVLFRGAKLLYFDCRRNEASPFIRMHMAADYSEPLIEEMSEFNWTNLPDAESSAKLTGELIGCESFTLTPAGLEANEMSNVSCISVGTFSLHRVKEGSGTTVQLRFVVKTIDPSASARLWEFWRIVMEAKGRMRVNYAVQSAVTKVGKNAKNENQPTLPELEKQVVEIGNKRGRPTRADQLAAAVAAEGSIEQ